MRNCENETKIVVTTDLINDIYSGIMECFYDYTDESIRIDIKDYYDTLSDEDIDYIVDKIYDIFEYDDRFEVIDDGDGHWHAEKKEK